MMCKEKWSLLAKTEISRREWRNRAGYLAREYGQRAGTTVAPWNLH